MLNSIIRFSVRNKLIVGLLILGWVVWGVIEVGKLPIDSLPDITSNQVQVITTSPTLAAPEVERLITFPLEQASSSIPGITEIRSISRFGLSVVTIVFNDRTDIYWARQQVSEKMGRVKDEIPREAGTPELAPTTTGLGEIYQYVVKPKKGYEGRYSLEELRSIQDWIVRRQLLGTPGVADVSSFGGKMKQYEVAIRPDRLKAMGVSISDVFDALEKNNQNSGGAYIEKGASLLFIRTEGLASTTDDIGRIPVRSTSSGIPVLIRDVADVRIGHAVRYGAMTYGSEGEVAGAVVLMLKGENASQVIKGIRNRMEQIRKTLPEGVELVTFLDRTKMVDRAIKTVKTNLVEGALIVVFVLVLFLGNLRAGLIVASVIPLAMLFAVGMMNLLGVSGNLMSLGALDFGLIVDGAVIIVEAVLHRLHLGGSKGHDVALRQGQMDDVVEKSASRMMNAAVFGQVIILIVYLPILSLVGIEGKMFRPMAQTVAFALLGAFILSLTYVPMMSALFLSKKASSSESVSDRMMDRIRSAYHALLKRILSWPKAALASTVLALALSLLVASRLGGEFIPELEEGDFAIDARILTGSSLTESIRVSTQAAEVLKRFPEVERIVTRIGASEIPTDPMPIEMTDIIVSLKDKDKWVSADSYDGLANLMSDALKEIPGLTSGFQYPVQMRFNELIAGARQDVVCKIFGEDLDSLASIAKRLSGIVQGIEGAKDVYVEAVTGLPQIVVRYKREPMALYGLSISEVNRAVRAAFAGDVAGKVYENERRYDLVVRMSERSRTDLADIRQLLLPTATGTQIPLEQVADVTIEEGPNQIQREDAKRRILVGFNTRGRDVQSVVQELERKVEGRLRMPSGYFVRYGGQFENLVEAKQRLMVAVPIALALIFIMLYFAFGSLKYGLLIFTAIPLSAIGGILSLWLRDMPFSISAGVGFIALFGVSVLNGIVLITEFNRLGKETNMDIPDIIMNGTGSRLRPVLMTAAVASLGFLPMALSQGAGAEVQRPLATVVIGGLVTATLLTLFVLPVLYMLFEKRRKRDSRGGMAAGAILLLAMPMSPCAQEIGGEPVSLKALLSLAGERNLSLKASRRNDDHWKALSERTFELPRTQLGVDYGRFNSINTDSRLFLNQTFQMPSVYRRNRNLYNAGLESNRALTDWKLAELQREVRLSYYSLLSMKERYLLLCRLDSVYRRSAEAAALRFRTGETGRMEKTAAEAHVEQIRLQLQQQQSDIRAEQEHLSWLLNDMTPWIPDGSEDDVKLIPADSIDPADHPEVQYIESQGRYIDRQAEAEKNRLAPEVNVGYNNLSLVGWQSPDGVSQRYYGTGDRFSFYQMTLGLPLFNGAARARIKAGEISRDVKRMESRNLAAGIEARMRQLEETHRKNTATVEHHVKTGLPQAELISSNAMKALKAGEISYLEWTVLMEQSVRIRMAHLDALEALRLSKTELIYLNGNR
jgi:cobalt-zinc-cadmium resistance protein CzcA